MRRGYIPRPNRPRAWIFVVAMILGLAAGAEELHPAQALVMQTTDEMLTRMRAERESLGRDTGKVIRLVEEIVLPHFDFENISASVLGKYWRTADPGQRRRFRDAFKRLLLHTYAVALVDNIDREIEFEAVRAPPGATDVTVRTSVPQDGGFPLPVDYSLELIDGEWKVYDVEIDGLSLVTNYRTTFAREINKAGLESLIETLETRSQDLGS
jgi:phospholipid transport system substrate-binding protein